MPSKELNFLLLHLALGFFVKSTASQDVLFTLNTKKVVATTSDKFLSLTLDPAVLLTGDVLASSTELSTNMAKALAPGYVRLAGPRSNSYTFERSLFPQAGYEDPDLTFSEAHWVLVQQWAQRAGLDVVSSLRPQRNENEDQSSSWDPRNSLDLISFSDHMGYNMSWQLGYECQTRCDVSGSDLGKSVARLRNMLSGFPRYSNSVVAGPDIVSFRGKQQQQFIQDYLNAAGNALTAITWHPDFAGIALDSDGVALQVDTLAADKDLLYRAMGRSMAKKPLWIAESKPEECKRQFLGALVWARRLGNAAKLGVQVVMRKPDISTMFQPTPDYWVSLLHKMLVGREVLDTKLTAGNKTHVHFYCQCTRPSAKYDRGAVTIFGINLTPGKVSVTLRGLKIKALHKYILMPGYDTDDRMFAETVLLNNEPLALVNGKNIPEINPAVGLMGKSMAVKLPSGGIGFWVIPGARVKSCLGHDDEVGDKNLLLKKLTKKFEDPEVGDENVGHEIEEENHNQESEVVSTEDIKSLLKSKKKKRKYRHSDEAEDEDRRFKRIDTKRELEKLERLLKRNGNNEDKKTSYLRGRGGGGGGGMSMFESGENKGENTSEDEDAGLVRLKKNEKSNSREDIRGKLEEYKNKLIEYETRKKTDETNHDRTQRTYARKFSTPEEQLLNDVDAQKAVEALALISTAIREIGSSSKEKMKYQEEGGTKSPIANPLNLRTSDIGEEIMIEELEKSDKTKRMADPKYFGDKIYRYFIGTGSGNVNSKRDKRDLEKLLGDDPLGLRKEGLFKKRLKADEAKERRFERRNRKKEKEEIGIKKELQVGRYDPRTTDSNENNFFGFQEMKPLENFPQGDLFLNEGSSSEEKSRDYDYVKDDDDEEEAAKQQRKRNKRRKAKNQRQSKPVQDETWVEEPNSNLHHAPNEFFERVNLPKVAIKTQWQNYDELYEPEALQQADLKEEQKAQENETDAVIVRDRTDERADKRAKETAVKKLINYYDNSETLRSEREGFKRQKPSSKGVRKEPKTRTQTPMLKSTKETLKIKPEEIEQQEIIKTTFQPDNDQYEDSDGPGSLEFVNSKAMDDYSAEEYDEDARNIETKKRPKRKIANLNFDIFDQEMIREDAGNLKDCKCRVIRSSGKLVCKDCKRSRRRQREIAEAIPQEDIIDPTSDRTSISNGAAAEDLLAKSSSEASKIIAEESAAQVLADSEEPTETSSATDADGSSQKNIEVADLNDDTISRASIGDESPQNSPSEIIDGVGAALESPTPLTDDPDPQEIGFSEAIEVENHLRTEPQVISSGTEGYAETEGSNDDAIGSQRLIDDEKEVEATDEVPEESPVTETVGDVEERKEMVEIVKNLSAEDVADDKNAKRHIPVTPDVDVEAKSGTRFSLSTTSDRESSGKTDLLKTKLKNGVDFKLKSGGLKNSDSAKSKLVLSTEALSALIKENESKKAEVIKALESSSKLKSVDNEKYAEYQRKREEKLASLKEKLRERRAKILQQYRQELLDALTKCDTEVERNLKRREIWENFSNQEEFQDFVDKEKLAYLAMNRPVNYEDIEERDSGYSDTEDRRYHPEIDMVQPLRSPREQKVPSDEHRGFFYGLKPKKFSSSSRESVLDQSSSENIDEPYYAIVESLENPQVFPKQHFDELQHPYKNEYDELMKMRDPDFGKYVDRRADEKFYPRQHTPRESAGAPVQTVYTMDGSGYYDGEPIIRVFDEDLGPEYEVVPYYDEFPNRERIVFQNAHRQEAPSWDTSIPEYHDGILHHREYSRPIYSSGDRQKNLVRVNRADRPDRDYRDPKEVSSPKRRDFRTGVKNSPDGLYGTDVADIPLRDGLRILKKFDSPCRDGSCGGNNNFGNIRELDESEIPFKEPMEDWRAFNEGEPLVRSERHLVPREKPILDEPGISSVRKERDVEEKSSNYVCLKEDSSENFGDEENRLFKLVRNGDHYEAVPVSYNQEDPGTGRQQKSHRPVAKQAEKVRIKRRKYNPEILTDEKGNFYLKNGGYLRRNSPKTNSEMGNFENQYKDDVEGKRHFHHDGVDYRLIDNDANRLESHPRLTPEEYELLMLIPVKKHKVVKRGKRELDNSIDRWESLEELNSVWDDVIDVKEGENRLQEYVDAKNKNSRDLEEAQANLNKHLKKLGESRNPAQIQRFKKIILNLGSHDQDEIAVVAQSQDDLDRIHLGEYLKQEILKKVDEMQKESTTSAPAVTGTTTPPSLFDATMPKLESAITGELEKVGTLTESLEDFIDDFEKKFNASSEINSNVTVTPSEVPKKNDKISYNIFHSAINSVKKFFNFLAGISHIFHRH